MYTRGLAVGWIHASHLAFSPIPPLIFTRVKKCKIWFYTLPKFGALRQRPSDEYRFWKIRNWDTRRNTSRTFGHRLPIFQVDLHWALHRVATSSCRGHVDELATEPFLCCTASMEQATDGAETTAIDGLVSSWSENISVWFCLRAPGYGLTLWCALGLLVGAQYKCLSCYCAACNADAV